jgi:HNH endonuclease/NUMOD1 domain
MCSCDGECKGHLETKGSHDIDEMGDIDVIGDMDAMCDVKNFGDRIDDAEAIDDDADNYETDDSDADSDNEYDSDVDSDIENHGDIELYDCSGSPAKEHTLREDERVIPKFPLYCISRDGKRLIRLDNSHILSRCKSGRYWRSKVQLSKGSLVYKWRSIHSLVMQAYGPVCPEDGVVYTIDHINRDFKDNSIENLRWATNKEQRANRNETSEHKGKWRPVIALNIETGDKHTYDSITKAAQELEPSLKLQNVINQIWCSLNSDGVKVVYGHTFKYDVPETGEVRSIPPTIMNGLTGYSASEKGYIINPKGRIKTGKTNHHGYVMINIGPRGSSKPYGVNRLVNAAFDPQLSYGDLIANHIDGNRQNNLKTNLEWTTLSGNSEHAARTGLIACKKVQQFSITGEPLTVYRGIREAGRSIKNADGTLKKDAFKGISACCRGKVYTAWNCVWAHVDTVSDAATDSEEYMKCARDYGQLHKPASKRKR